VKREILTTGDGSVTIHIPEWNEQYHSKHGAIAEAEHVFIKAGLHHLLSRKNKNQGINILEIGFGTGLNAFLTLLYSSKNSIYINYTGVEAYPVATSEIEQLNYTSILEVSKAPFEKLHQTPWERSIKIEDHFKLTKKQQFFSEIESVSEYQLIYFDAFGARVQPELWTEEIFSKNVYRIVR